MTEQAPVSRSTVTRSTDAAAPRLPRIYLPRPTLWRALDRGAQRGLSIVIAPPGAGKTLGVAGWVRARPQPEGSVWLNAHRSADVVFLRALLDDAALVGDRPSSEPTPALIVVDDAHQLQPSALARIESRLSDCPDRIRLVLLTRWDLALQQLVPGLLGNLTVLRGDMLRLSTDDSAVLVREHARTSDPEVIEAITTRAQGWCAAVVLASRATATAPDERAFARRYRESGSPVDKLVADEVFVALRTAERHLLLCIAQEDEVTVSLAQQLTADPRAGEVLASLESTGLLVNREVEHGAATEHDEIRFRVHPLLRDVAQRRLTAGGVEVEQAKSTVRRAIRAQIARGDVSSAFRRLVDIGDFQAAAVQLAENTMILTMGESRTHVDILGRRGAAAVESNPGCWLGLALERRLSGDAVGTLHWLDRLLKVPPAGQGTDHALMAGIAATMHARLGLQPIEPVVIEARRLLIGAGASAQSDSLISLLILELGAAEAWLGNLSTASIDLTAAVQAGRATGLVHLRVRALSYLAMTLMMQSREDAARAAADEALEVSQEISAEARGARDRAELVIDLCEHRTAPWRADRDAVGSELRSFRGPAIEPLDQFWRRILTVCALFRQGSLDEAQLVLERPLAVPTLPRQLQIVRLSTRARLGYIAHRREPLREVGEEFARLDHPIGMLWVEAALAELGGDLERAASRYLEALSSEDIDPVSTQDVCRVSAAQLLDRLARQESADDLVDETIARSEIRGDNVAFFGWSLHGSTVEVLLRRAMSRRRSRWTATLITGVADCGDLHNHFSQILGTPQELDRVDTPVVRPSLSPRERDVLQELARGSTYADIAANLFVSENTVKTHISSLYAKLSVGRRSGALAVARKLNLL